ESIYWKEMLGVLSFEMNYPAKYFSAEDMIRLRKTLIPLISLVIAYIPQSSCDVLIALHHEGLLEIISVGEESEIIPHSGGGVTLIYTDEKEIEQQINYKTFVDCIGQPALSYKEFPFKSLLESETISPAYLKFRSNEIGKAAFE